MYVHVDQRALNFPKGMQSRRSTKSMTDQFALADSAAQLILQRTHSAPEDRPRPRLRPRRLRRLAHRRHARSLRRHSRRSRDRPPSVTPGRWCIGNAGSIPVAAMQGRVHLYEGYSAAGSHLPHPRLRTHGHSRRHPHQRRRRHQSQLLAGRARRDPRPHQSARRESAGRPQRRPLRRPLPRHDARLLRKSIARSRAKKPAS